MRIIDAIEAGKYLLLPGNSTPYARAARELPVIDLTEVHSILDPDVDAGSENLSMHDIKAVPPFDAMWAVDRFANKDELVGTQWALLLQRVPSDTGGPYLDLYAEHFPGAQYHMRADVFAMLPRGSHVPDKAIFIGAGACATTEYFELIKAQSTSGGNSRGDWTDYVAVLMDAKMASQTMEAGRGAVVQEMSGVLFMMALLNCKNVSLEEAPYLRTKPVIRWGKNKNKIAGKCRYYVLDVEPMKKHFGGLGEGGGISSAKALHICRGHFKDYREKPLFGKVSGMFWWQPHVRGTAEAGIVEKDYRIKLP